MSVDWMPAQPHQHSAGWTTQPLHYRYHVCLLHMHRCNRPFSCLLSTLAWASLARLLLKAAAMIGVHSGNQSHGDAQCREACRMQASRAPRQLVHATAQHTTVEMSAAVLLDSSRDGRLTRSGRSTHAQALPASCTGLSDRAPRQVGTAAHGN